MIDEFRTIWHAADDCAAEATVAPRAAGKVAAWSLERSARILKAGARTTINIGHGSDGRVATPHERSLQAVADSLARNNHQTARAYAQWLVRRDYVDALLRALEPVATGPARLVA